MNIIVYTKTGCHWGTEVKNFLKSKSLPFEERNMTENENFKKEAMEKSGVFKCPTIDIDGHILVDSDTKQLEEYLKQIGVLV